jgi:hypothetical protein
LDCQCEEVRPFEADRETLFCVIWKCPRCEFRALIVSVTGPLIVQPGMCLNCGQAGVAREAACSSCGAQLREAITAADEALPDDALLLKARDAFELGACRRGLTIVNFVLERNAKCAEAWSIKGQFLQYLGFRVALKIVMQEAVRQTGSTG